MSCYLYGFLIRNVKSFLAMQGKVIFNQLNNWSLIKILNFRNMNKWIVGFSCFGSSNNIIIIVLMYPKAQIKANINFAVTVLVQFYFIDYAVAVILQSLPLHNFSASYFVSKTFENKQLYILRSVMILSFMFAT